MRAGSLVVSVRSSRTRRVAVDPLVQPLASRRRRTRPPARRRRARPARRSVSTPSLTISDQIFRPRRSATPGSDASGTAPMPSWRVAPSGTRSATRAPIECETSSIDQRRQVDQRLVGLDEEVEVRRRRTHRLRRCRACVGSPGRSPDRRPRGTPRWRLAARSPQLPARPCRRRHVRCAPPRRRAAARLRNSTGTSDSRDGMYRRCGLLRIPGPTKQVSSVTPSRSGIPDWAFSAQSRYSGTAASIACDQRAGRGVVAADDDARVVHRAPQRPPPQRSRSPRSRTHPRDSHAEFTHMAEHIRCIENR